MRSATAGTTLLMIMGMFFFQESNSFSHQPNKQSLTNSIGIKLMLIPKGKFLMGSPRTETGQRTIETQHEVTISKNFYMGSTEVTQAQWQKVMGTNPSYFKGDELPVENVTWEESIEFCKRLSEMPEEKKAGRRYRLPTESEWEYACRAGTTTPFHFGSQLNGNQANCNGKRPYGTDTHGPNLEKTSAVGKYVANAWGLYDMHGNVWEWCSDWYDDYPNGTVTDPNGPATGLVRVDRGGSWGLEAVRCRSADRCGAHPSVCDNYLGFRLALSSIDETTEIQDPKLLDKPTVRHDPMEITNSIGIKLMRITKGKFMMGSPESEHGRSKDEIQREVTINSNFYLGATEVTQAQWQKVMGNNPSFFKRDELPVESISWEEAVEFCKRLSEMPEEKKAGRKYRLPTEAEWEYACRAGTTTPFHFGSKLNGTQANCNGMGPYGTEAEGPHIKETTPARKYSGNAWGLYDMHGNVWEWCSDWYTDPSVGFVTAPTGPATGLIPVYRGYGWLFGAFRSWLPFHYWSEVPPPRVSPPRVSSPRTVTDPSGPVIGSDRVNRGGSWRFDAMRCRSAYRSWDLPSIRRNNLGFRLALGSMDEATAIKDSTLKDRPRVMQDSNEITNSIGIKLMLIPKGKFLMGSPRTEKARNIHEIQHEVTISQNFYMGSTEVTQAQWQKVMGANPIRKSDDMPIDTVSWYEVIDFCKRLSEMPEEKKAGRKYRLPTEAEWEYACRAGTTSPFHFGSQLNGTQANCNGTFPFGTDTKGPYLEKPTAVRKYPANAWGLYDMHGNVWEWCSDWFEGYPTGSVTDPSNPANGTSIVFRGGSMIDSAALCRSAVRRMDVPSLRIDTLGFRVVMTSFGNPSKSLVGD